MTTYEEAYAKLEQYGQLHVLRYYKELPETEQAELLRQVKAVSYTHLRAHETSV